MRIYFDRELFEYYVLRERIIGICDEADVPLVVDVVLMH
jgi:hypothetical protein